MASTVDAIDRYTQDITKAEAKVVRQQSRLNE
jgi:hypothetical protein